MKLGIGRKLITALFFGFFTGGVSFLFVRYVDLDDRTGFLMVVLAGFLSFTSIMRYNFDGATHLKQGFMFQQKGEYDQALISYRQAIETMSHEPQIYINRGNIYIDQKRYELAIADFNTVLQINPQHKFGIVIWIVIKRISIKHNVILKKHCS